MGEDVKDNAYKKCKSGIIHSKSDDLKKKRTSFGFGGSAIKRESRFQTIDFGTRKPVTLFLPTYRLESKNPFRIDEVERIIREVLDPEVKTHRYHSEETPRLAHKMTSEMLQKIKKFNYDRYRLMLVMTASQKRMQSVHLTISFMWDAAQDRYAHVNAESSTCHWAVTCFGVYLD